MRKEQEAAFRKRRFECNSETGEKSLRLKRTVRLKHPINNGSEGARKP